MLDKSRTHPLMDTNIFTLFVQVHWNSQSKLESPGKKYLAFLSWTWLAWLETKGFHKHSCLFLYLAFCSNLCYWTEYILSVFQILSCSFSYSVIYNSECPSVSVISFYPQWSFSLLLYLLWDGICNLWACRLFNLSLITFPCVSSTQLPDFPPEWTLKQFNIFIFITVIGSL